MRRGLARARAGLTFDEKMVLVLFMSGDALRLVDSS
jgi:hypothetical protein